MDEVDFYSEVRSKKDDIQQHGEDLLMESLRFHSPSQAFTTALEKTYEKIREIRTSG